MCQACAPQFNTEQSDAFTGKMIGIFNNAAIALMISIGHRTGLFDTMAEMEPATSEAIAEAGNLNERYVREWLGAMTVAEIVQYDPHVQTYRLPEEYAVWLTRKATPNNLAVTTTYIPVLASVEDEIVDCFREGGGVPYERFHRFHEVMAEESAQTVVAPLIDQILPLAEGLTEKLEAGARVLDLGCGSGRALQVLAERFPRSHFTGYDLCADAIARANAGKKGTTNLEFFQCDVATLTAPEKFDVILTFDSIHDQAHPDRVLRNIYHLLKDDGIYFMQDIAGSSDLENNRTHPVAPLLYTISCLHCMTVSLAQGGMGLGAMWGVELTAQMVRQAGFTQLETRQLEHDFMNNFYVIRK